MKRLNHILKKCTGDYKFKRLQEMLNYFRYTMIFKKFPRTKKNKKPCTNDKNIQTKEVPVVK